MENYKSKFQEASFGEIVKAFDSSINFSYDLMESLKKKNDLSGGDFVVLRSKATELRDNLNYILKNFL